jgi:DNA invertase Pin-like site-specific DNA recombinase
VTARRLAGVGGAAFDRVGRSGRPLGEPLDRVRQRGVELLALRAPIDTGSPLGQAVGTLRAARAQGGRRGIVARVTAGRRRATADGTRRGREPRRVEPARLRAVLRKAPRAGTAAADGASRAAEGGSLA